MKIVVRYIAEELDAIAEMVYRFNHSLYGHELGTQPEVEPHALTAIKRRVLDCVKNITLDTTHTGTMGFIIQVLEHEVIDDVTYIDVEFTFNAATYGNIRNYELVEVEINK